MQELYFCLQLDKNEHRVVQHFFQKECDRLKCELVYYRKLTQGHIRGFREIKIRGSRHQIDLFKQYLYEHEYVPYLVKNPHGKIPN